MNPFEALQNLSLYPQSPYQELLSDEQLKAARSHGLLQMGAGMLANSGWSPQKRSFGEILGQGVMQGSQMQGRALNQASQLEMLKQQMAMKQQPKFAAPKADDYTPESFRQYMATNDPSVLVPREKPFNLGYGAKRVGPDGQVLAENPRVPSAPTTRTIDRGTERVQQEYDPNRGEWRDVGGGPRFGRTPEDAAMMRRGEQRYEESRATINNVEGATSLLRKLGPGVSGARGIIGDVAGGIAGQVSPVLGKSVTRGITGTDDQQLAQIRTEAQVLASRMIPVVTGEQSGRFTEAERELSTKVAAGNLDFLKSPTQARGALVTLTQVALKDEYISRAMNGEPIANDLNTPQGVDAMQEALVQRGLTDDEAIRVIKEVRNSTLPLMGQGNIRPLF